MGHTARTRAQRDTTPPGCDHQVPLNRIHIIRRCRGAAASLELPQARRRSPAKSGLQALRKAARDFRPWATSGPNRLPVPAHIQHRPSRSLIVTIGSDERSEARSNQPTDRVASSRRRDRCVRADRVATTASLRAALFSLSTVLEESRSEVHARARGRARCDHRARRVV